PVNQPMSQRPVATSWRAYEATGTMVALDSNLKRTYALSDNARVVKWPSGALPRAKQAMAIGRPAVGDPLAAPLRGGLLDERIVTQERDVDGRDGEVIGLKEQRRIEEVSNDKTSPYVTSRSATTLGVGGAVRGTQAFWASGPLLRIVDDAVSTDGARVG